MDRILRPMPGALIRPPSCWRSLRQGVGPGDRRGRVPECLRQAVSDIVARQVEVGIDVVDDGEMGKSSWITYLYERVSGLELRPIEPEGRACSRRAATARRSPAPTRALDALDEAANRESNNAGGALADGEPPTATAIAWVCTGPLSYDRTALDRDIANLKAALAGHDDVEAFLPVVAPASAYWLRTSTTPTEEEFVFALADALHEEYKRDRRRRPDPAGRRRGADARGRHDDVARASRGRTTGAGPTCACGALNHALRGLPEDRIRYHVCWGSWHGPHAFDPPLRDIVDLLLAVNAGYYAIEQANPRHEHEWRVWEEVTLPEGKKLIPGVVTHHTNVVEHPELVAQRLSGSPSSSAARTCSPAPTAASHRARSSSACTPRSSGPSSRRSPRERGWHRGSFGARPAAA